MELVSVTFSANTFSTLMYNVMDSDGLISALFFATVIVIPYFWLVVLLIGVITQSIQELRQSTDRKPCTLENIKSLQGTVGLECKPRNTRTSLQRAFRKTKWLWIAVITFDHVMQT
jgi:hypothetical protein